MFDTQSFKNANKLKESKNISAEQPLIRHQPFASWTGRKSEVNKILIKSDTANESRLIDVSIRSVG